MFGFVPMARPNNLPNISCAGCSASGSKTYADERPFRPPGAEQDVPDVPRAARSPAWCPPFERAARRREMSYSLTRGVWEVRWRGGDGRQRSRRFGDDSGPHKRSMKRSTMKRPRNASQRATGRTAVSTPMRPRRARGGGAGSSARMGSGLRSVGSQARARRRTGGVVSLSGSSGARSSTRRRPSASSSRAG